MDRRQSSRQWIIVAVRVRVEDQEWVGVIKNLSRSGAFVTDVPLIWRGADVQLTISLDDGQHVTTGGRVIHDVDRRHPFQVGGSLGIGVRFHDPITAEAARFDAAIAQMLAPRVYTPTRRLIPPVLSSLKSACSSPTTEGRPVFAGSIAEVGVPTLLTIIERARKSGLLVLRRGYMSVTICWHDGRMLDARSSVLAEPPHEALLRAIRWSDGTFELSPLTWPSRRVCKLPSVTQLLLGARMQSQRATRSAT